jgi:hypothetical protein
MLAMQERKLSKIKNKLFDENYVFTVRFFQDKNCE